jgi:hypothetical protein
MSEATIFIPPHALNTAVLFLVFNRLDATKQVFEAIRQAKPPRLYVAADGARANKEGEADKAQAVRDYIMQNIDWKCEVKTLFQEENLGCKYAVSGAITWFFENEEQGIILEDDCLPSQSFFWFCEELLERYKDDIRVWNIGGYKPLYLKGDKYSYNFSRFTHIWGWASWANRWKYYDATLSKYKENKDLLIDYEFFREDYENKSRNKILERVILGEIDTWDYQWNFTVRINNGLSIRPSVNLVGNVGFGDDATHTFVNDIEIESNKANDIIFPLMHPDNIMVYKKDDKLFGEKNLDSRLFTRVARKLNGKA